MWEPAPLRLHPFLDEYLNILESGTTGARQVARMQVLGSLSPGISTFAWDVKKKDEQIHLLNRAEDVSYVLYECLKYKPGDSF